MRIRWTDREWMLIAYWLVKNECDPHKHGLRGYVKQAMQISLPKDRWRNINSMDNLKSVLLPYMSAAKSAPKQEKPSAVEEAKITLDTASNEQLTEELTRRFFENVKGLIYQITHEACEDAIKKHLTELQQPQSLFFDTRPFNQKRNPQPLSSEKDKKQTILVVGPISSQQNALKAMLPDVDLRFVGSNDRPNLIIDKMKGASATVLWTNFISHAHQDVAKNSTGVVYMASGGIGNLADTILRIAINLD